MDEEEPAKQKFTICGLMVDGYFQLSKFLVNKLHRSFPEEYATPCIRPMLDLQWDEFVLKMRREIGGKAWLLRVNVAVFLDDEFLGSHKDLLKLINTRFAISTSFDFNKMGRWDLRDYLLDITCKYRQLVYLTVEIDRKIVGSLLFELFNDLVPNMCENFLRTCEEVGDFGYVGKSIQRVVAGSFIQCGGWCWPQENRHQRCENYIVPLERRGILGMCNAGRHKDNTTQFFITLDPTTWMNYRYVAFGQLIHGNYVLKEIEKVPTDHEMPIIPVTIVKSGEFRLTPFKDEMELVDKKDLDAYIDNIVRKGEEDSQIIKEPESILNLNRLLKGIYGLPFSPKGLSPLLRLPEYLLSYVQETDQKEGLDEKISQPETPCSELEYILTTSSSDISIITL